MYHFLKINVIYLWQRIFNYCNILKRVMKNTGLFVFCFHCVSVQQVVWMMKQISLVVVTSM